ncbi:MAG TPA: prepilin peptidase [Vicinamibacterales bacterium]|nr:prepilin peptidase [Vicinamibacterales bacterium]
MSAVHLTALAIAVVACVTDLRSRRIPNVLTFGSAAAALVFHVATGGVGGLVSACEGWAVGVAFFFLPFALGGMGGGDIKLVAALGAWMGPGAAFWLGLYTGIAGGVFAVVVSICRGYLGQAMSNIWLLLTHWRVAGLRPLDEVSLAGSRGPRLAYAVPIFTGTVLTIWFRP